MRSPAEIFESVLRPCVWVLIVGLLGLGYAGDALAVYEMTNGGDGVEGDPGDSQDFAGGGSSDQGDGVGGLISSPAPRPWDVGREFELVIFVDTGSGVYIVKVVPFSSELVHRPRSCW